MQNLTLHDPKRGPNPGEEIMTLEKQVNIINIQKQTCQEQFTVLSLHLFQSFNFWITKNERSSSHFIVLNCNKLVQILRIVLRILKNFVFEPGTEKNSSNCILKIIYLTFH